MTLNDKVAVITGGSRGIGRAACLKLAALGATVGINYVANPNAAEETLSLIKEKGGKGFIIQFDVSDNSQVQKAFKDVSSEYGGVDVLVNNAGITRDGLMARMKEINWDIVMDTNLKGMFNCSKAAARGMMKKRNGRIINISSVIGFLGNGGQANYAAAKAGMVGLSRSMAREYSSRNITVNCVAPGYITTDMTAELPENIKDDIKAQVPLGTLGTPEDVAHAIAFLALDESSYITGQVIHVNGGMYMG